MLEKFRNYSKYEFIKYHEMSYWTQILSWKIAIYKPLSISQGGINLRTCSLEKLKYIV